MVKDSNINLVEQKLDMTVDRVDNLTNNVRDLEKSTIEQKEKVKFLNYEIEDLKQKKASVHNVRNQAQKIQGLFDINKDHDKRLTENEKSLSNLAQLTAAQTKDIDKLVKRLSKFSHPTIIGLIITLGMMSQLDESTRGKLIKFLIIHEQPASVQFSLIL